MAPRMEALPAALGITSKETLALVQDHPQLLLLPTPTILSGWEQLQAAADLRPEWREQVGGWSVSSFCRWGALPTAHMRRLHLVDNRRTQHEGAKSA
jgi:hypothetical protein